MSNQPYNSSDPDQVEDARLRAKFASDAEQADFRAIMSSEVGRRFMYRLLDMTGVFRSSFTGNSSTYFNEGQRNVGLQHMALINKCCLDEYVTMLKENSEGDENDRNSSSD